MALRSAQLLCKVESIIGYVFKNPHYLCEAVQVPGITRPGNGFEISHRAAETYGRAFSLSNKNLALVGDSVLKTALLENWYRSGDQRGDIVYNIVNRIVSNHNLSIVGRVHLYDTLIQSSRAKALTLRPHYMADTIEALLGAVYLDDGLVSVHKVMANLNLRYKALHQAIVTDSPSALGMQSESSRKQILVHETTQSAQELLEFDPKDVVFPIDRTQLTTALLEIAIASARQLKSLVVQIRNACLASSTLRTDLVMIDTTCSAHEIRIRMQSWIEFAKLRSWKLDWRPRQPGCSLHDALLLVQGTCKDMISDLKEMPELRRSKAAATGHEIIRNFAKSLKSLLDHARNFHLVAAAQGETNLAVLQSDIRIASDSGWQVQSLVDTLHVSGPRSQLPQTNAAVSEEESNAQIKSSQLGSGASQAGGHVQGQMNHFGSSFQFLDENFVRPYLDVEKASTKLLRYLQWTQASSSTTICRPIESVITSGRQMQSSLYLLYMRYDYHVFFRHQSSFSRLETHLRTYKLTGYADLPTPLQRSLKTTMESGRKVQSRAYFLLKLAMDKDCMDEYRHTTSLRLMKSTEKQALYSDTSLTPRVATPKDAPSTKTKARPQVRTITKQMRLLLQAFQINSLHSLANPLKVLVTSGKKLHDLAQSLQTPIPHPVVLEYVRTFDQLKELVQRPRFLENCTTLVIPPLKDAVESGRQVYSSSVSLLWLDPKKFFKINKIDSSSNAVINTKKQSPRPNVSLRTVASAPRTSISSKTSEMPQVHSIANPLHRPVFNETIQSKENWMQTVVDAVKKARAIPEQQLMPLLNAIEDVRNPARQLQGLATLFNELQLSKDAQALGPRKLNIKRVDSGPHPVMPTAYHKTSGPSGSQQLFRYL